MASCQGIKFSSKEYIIMHTETAGPGVIDFKAQLHPERSRIMCDEFIADNEKKDANSTFHKIFAPASKSCETVVIKRNFTIKS
jgi:hypothetical protein